MAGDRVVIPEAIKLQAEGIKENIESRSQQFQKALYAMEQFNSTPELTFQGRVADTLRNQMTAQIILMQSGLSACEAIQMDCDLLVERVGDKELREADLLAQIELQEKAIARSQERIEAYAATPPVMTEVYGYSNLVITEGEMIKSAEALIEAYKADIALIDEIEANTSGLFVSASEVFDGFVAAVGIVGESGQNGFTLSAEESQLQDLYEKATRAVVFNPDGSLREEFVSKISDKSEEEMSLREQNQLSLMIKYLLTDASTDEMEMVIKNYYEIGEFGDKVPKKTAVEFAHTVSEAAQKIGKTGETDPEEYKRIIQRSTLLTTAVTQDGMFGMENLHISQQEGSYHFEYRKSTGRNTDVDGVQTCYPGGIVEFVIDLPAGGTEYVDGLHVTSMLDEQVEDKVIKMNQWDTVSDELMEISSSIAIAVATGIVTGGMGLPLAASLVKTGVQTGSKSIAKASESIDQANRNMKMMDADDCHYTIGALTGYVAVANEENGEELIVNVYPTEHTENLIKAYNQAMKEYGVEGEIDMDGFLNRPAEVNEMLIDLRDEMKKKAPEGVDSYEAFEAIKDNYFNNLNQSQ